MFLATPYPKISVFVFAKTSHEAAESAAFGHQELSPTQIYTHVSMNIMSDATSVLNRSDL